MESFSLAVLSIDLITPRLAELIVERHELIVEPLVFGLTLSLAGNIVPFRSVEHLLLMTISRGTRYAVHLGVAKRAFWLNLSLVIHDAQVEGRNLERTPTRSVVGAR